MQSIQKNNMIHIVGNPLEHFDLLENVISFRQFLIQITHFYEKCQSIIWVAGQGLTIEQHSLLQLLAESDLSLAIIHYIVPNQSSVQVDIINPSFTFNSIQQLESKHFQAQLHVHDCGERYTSYQIDALLLSSASVQFLEHMLENSDIQLELKQLTVSVKNKLFPLKINMECQIRKISNMRRTAIVYAVTRFYQSGLLCVEMEIQAEIIECTQAKINNLALAQTMIMKQAQWFE
jgi:hypothetical protein